MQNWHDIAGEISSWEWAQKLTWTLKLQFLQLKVTYLGHVIIGEGKTLYPKHAAAIQSVPKPVTKKQMMSLLGMMSFCRQWIPHYSEKEAYCLPWQIAKTLGLPNRNLPYTQFGDQKGCFMIFTLCVPPGGKYLLLNFHHNCMHLQPPCLTRHCGIFR